MNVSIEFSNVLESYGLETLDLIIPDGKLRRFHVEGDSAGSRNGWYVFYMDSIAAGAFGSWKTGKKHRWCAKKVNELSDLERSEYRQRINQAMKERAAEQKKLHAEIAENSKRKWNNACGEINHAYVRNKGVESYGIRQLGDELLVPLYFNGKLVSLQRIFPNGRKRFETGGRVKGCYYPIGKPEDVVYICEGYATGATIHEAISKAVCLTFNAGNLKSVAQMLRKKYPDIRLVLCADDDQWMEDNPGITKGKEAAQAAGCDIAIPQFEDTSSYPTDFNDLAKLEGLNVVRQQIEKAEPALEKPCFENVTDPKQIIAMLAELNPIEYEQLREKTAKKLKFRTSILDQEVAIVRAEQAPGPDTGKGRAIKLYEPEPWPTAVNGVDVFNGAFEIIKRHMVITDHEAYACVLWAAHQHIFDIFSHTPRLLITAPDAECGKTLLMTHIVGNMLTRPKAAESLSPAPFFRLTELYKPAFLIDEVDAFIEKDSDLLPGINNGWEPHGNVIRCVGDDHEPREFSTHTPVAMSGINLSKKRPTTTFSRSIVINLERAAEDEIDENDIYDAKKHKSVILGVGRKLNRWCADNKEKIHQEEPMLPPKVRNRTADKWSPLFSIAQVVGGDWPDYAKKALFGQADLSEPSKSSQLLAASRDVIYKHESKIFSKDLIDRLCQLEESPWADYNFRKRDLLRRRISERQLSNLLKPYQINSKQIRIGGNSNKGYEVAPLQKAWHRYLKPLYPPNLSETAKQISNHAGSRGSPSETLNKVVSDGESLQPTVGAGCFAVSDRKGVPPGKGKENPKNDEIFY